jgi:hypothetical protein
MNERAIIADITQGDEDAGAIVSITLDLAGTEHRGAAVGSKSPRERPRLVGEAALRAVESMTGGAVKLDLLAVASADIGDAQVAVAQVRLDPFDEVLVGSALYRAEDKDGSWAVARAVMDALNRRLGTVI